jgi:Ras-related protein Rab-11A
LQICSRCHISGPLIPDFHLFITRHCTLSAAFPAVPARSRCALSDHPHFFIAKSIAQPFSGSVLPIEAREPDFLFKLILAGDSGVGKTSLLSRFARSKFNPDAKTTIGVEFATKTVAVGGQVVKAQVWDTAGQERYRSVTTSYYKGAIGALFVYDLTSSPTFQSVPRWLAELRAGADPAVLVMLVGNKLDRAELRAVTAAECANYAEREGLLFLEASTPRLRRSSRSRWRGAGPGGASGCC